MGEGAVLFDEHTWKTHILNPAAVAVYDALAASSQDGPAQRHEAVEFLQDELGLDPNSKEASNLLAMLKRLGVVA